MYKTVCADGVVKFEKSDLPDLDWTDMVETYDAYSYSRYVNSSFCTGDTLVGLTNDDDGNNLLVAFDLKTGKYTEHYIQDLNAAAPVGDGQILITTYVWSEGGSPVNFALYNLADESTVSKGEMKITDYSLPQNLYYNAETDTLYYTLGGEIWAAAGFDFENSRGRERPVRGAGDQGRLYAAGRLANHRAAQPQSRRALRDHAAHQRLRLCKRRRYRLLQVHQRAW